MDYQIGSKKIIIAAVVFSLFFICLSFVRDQFFGAQRVTLCSNGQHIVVVFQLKKHTTVLIPSSNLKDTLDCLRRGMNSYSRNIDLLITSHLSDTSLQELRSRYHIKKEIPQFTSISGYPIYSSEDMLLIDSQVLYGISLSSITNPFTFVDFVNNDTPEIIYVPKIDILIKQMMNVRIKNKTAIVELLEGEHVTISL